MSFFILFGHYFVRRWVPPNLKSRTDNRGRTLGRATGMCSKYSYSRTIHRMTGRRPLRGKRPRERFGHTMLVNDARECERDEAFLREGRDEALCQIIRERDEVLRIVQNTVPVDASLWLYGKDLNTARRVPVRVIRPIIQDHFGDGLLCIRATKPRKELPCPAALHW
jgi:hypothetical protein